MNGPTIYAKLMDRASAEPYEEINSHVRRVAHQVSIDLSNALEDQLRRAYVAGVTDGYAQAVAELEDQPAVGKVDA